MTAGTRLDVLATAPGPRWHLVIPVKGRVGAKTRLAPPAGVSRSDLAVAMALDTVAAALSALAGTGTVTVVTGEAAVAGRVAGLGARVVPDPGRGLLAAVAAGLAGRGGAPSAVLLGDLPTLRPEDLRVALVACAAHERAFVPDEECLGTVLLTALAGVEPHPRFGPGSAAAHAASGHVSLPLDLPSLRGDVDDLGSLARALAVGVGPRTTAVLRAAVAPN